MSITLRSANELDREAVCALCARLDPQDYMIQAWDEWLAAPGADLLLAHHEGALIGTVYAATVAPGQVFSQGLRVDPAYRRLGVATTLINEQTRRLSARGVAIARCVTGSANRPARTLLPSVAWTEQFEIRRRRLPAWKSPGLYRRDNVAIELPERLVVSVLGRAFYRRIYFEASYPWLETEAKAGRWHRQGEAYALLGPPSPECGTWIVALGGPLDSLRRLLQELQSPWTEPRGLTIEAPADPELQALLDDLGFAAPGTEDCYVVLAQDLANQTIL